jgi:hypothetical protein
MEHHPQGHGLGEEGSLTDFLNRIDHSLLGHVLLVTLGFRSFDALHVAAAERAGTNCFLTTDDKLRKIAARHAGVLKTTVMNPVQWIWSQMI